MAHLENNEHVSVKPETKNERLVVDLANPNLLKTDLVASANVGKPDVANQLFGKLDITSTDNAASEKIALFGNSNKHDQFTYVHEKTTGIMEGRTGIYNAFAHFTGASFGWEAKSSQVENIMNDTADIHFQNAKDKRDYLNTVAADFNKNWGSMTITQNRMMSEISGHPHAAVDAQNKIEVFLVDNNGQKVQYDNLRKSH